MSSPAVRIIVETITSETDRNGNRYHFARFYAVQRGRECFLTMETDGESNGRSLALKACGDDYEAVMSFARTIPKKQWQACRPPYVDEATALAKIKAAISLEDTNR